MIPIAPFTTATPLVVPGDSKLVVHVNTDGCRNGCLVTVDGRPGKHIFPGQSLVVKKSSHPARIITKRLANSGELEFGYKSVPFSGCLNKKP